MAKQSSYMIHEESSRHIVGARYHVFFTPDLIGEPAFALEAYSPDLNNPNGKLEARQTFYWVTDAVAAGDAFLTALIGETAA